MNKRLRALLERKNKAVTAARAITTAADTANRDITAEEQTQFDAHMAEVEKCNADIAREQALIDAERSGSALEVPDNARIEVSGPAILQDPRYGFQSYGGFAHAVMQAGVRGVIDQRLEMVAAASTYGSEGNMQDGGFLVPPEFSREVFSHSLEEDAILPLTDDYPVEGNSLTFPRDETTPWGTDGIRAYWAAEAAAATATKPKGSVATLRTSKLLALVPVTDELAQDANALERYIGRKTAESIRWKTNLAFWAGNGVGQPLGWFGHASQVSVAKETGQTAATVVADNVAKMYARIPGANKRSAVWMMNDDVFPQIVTMKLGDQPVWTPPNSGMKDAPAGFLLGRPIMLTQLCQTLGTQGDIAFVNWKGYRTITKAGAGIETATSMHLYFDAAQTAFRAMFRTDGQPAAASYITPNNGSSNLSHFVVLDTRS